jgi:lipopolysaccharide export system protein LptA
VNNPYFSNAFNKGGTMRKAARLSVVPLCLLAAKAPSQENAETLNLEAGHVELLDKSQKAIFTGNVRAKQGEMTITASAATVTYTGNVLTSGKKLELKRVVANGHVLIKRPNETATGNWAIYNLDIRSIILIGDVTLQRPTGFVSGGRLTINLDTNLAVMNSSAVNAPALNQLGKTEPASSGRITGTFTVPPR